jgi:hypothetical protein
MQVHPFPTQKHKEEGSAKTKNNIKKVNTKGRRRIYLMRVLRQIFDGITVMVREIKRISKHIEMDRDRRLIIKKE